MRIYTGGQTFESLRFFYIKYTNLIEINISKLDTFYTQRLWAQTCLFVPGWFEQMLLVGLLCGFCWLVARCVFCALVSSALRGGILRGCAGLMRQTGGGAVLDWQLLPRHLPPSETRLGRLEEVPALWAGLGGRGVGGRADGQLVGGLRLHALRGRRGHGGLTDRMNGGRGSGQRGGRAGARRRLRGDAHQNLLLKILLTPQRDSHQLKLKHVRY